MLSVATILDYILEKSKFDFSNSIFIQTVIKHEIRLGSRTTINGVNLLEHPQDFVLHRISQESLKLAEVLLESSDSHHTADLNFLGSHVPDGNEGTQLLSQVKKSMDYL